LVEYATLRAPFAGVVTRRHVEVGHSLQPSAGGGAGEAVFVVARMDPVRVFVDVPEAEAGLVADGTPAAVTAQALPGATFRGAGTRTAWGLDPRQRTLRAEIDLPNPDGKLRPGMYAYAVLSVSRPGRLAVPATAVVAQGDQKQFYNRLFLTCYSSTGL
jgi:multidrug efflux pump subunit AcrA (membrane-fusion protein)